MRGSHTVFIRIGCTTVISAKNAITPSPIRPIGFSENRAHELRKPRIIRPSRTRQSGTCLNSATGLPALPVIFGCKSVVMTAVLRAYSLSFPPVANAGVEVNIANIHDQMADQRQYPQNGKRGHGERDIGLQRRIKQ